MNSRFSVVLLSLAVCVCVGIPVGILGYLGHYYTFSASSVVVVSADIRRFEAVVHRLPDDESLWPEILEAQYLGQGSRAVQSFESVVQLNGAKLADLVAADPNGWASCQLRDVVLARESEIRAGLSRFEALYPGAIFPRIYFVVGSGLVREIDTLTGVIVPAEMFTGDGDACTPRPARTLGSQQVPCQVVHALVHFNQKLWSPFAYRSENNLDKAIREGSADFLAQLTVGCHLNSAAHAWGRVRRDTLWAEFREIADADAPGDWFDVEPARDRPKNLGAFIGYSIVESYYDRAADKGTAIEETMDLGDSRTILQESGYIRSEQ